MQSRHAGFSARARFARVLACNLLIFKNLARARRARVLSVRVLRAHAFCTQKQNKENSTGGVMERPSSEIACTQYFRLTVTKLTLRSNSSFFYSMPKSVVLIDFCLVPSNKKFKKKREITCIHKISTSIF